VSACSTASELNPGAFVGALILNFSSLGCPLFGAVARIVCGNVLCVLAGVVACYPSLQMHAMRDARGLHSDLKKTASLELLHQQQVEAEERQSSLAAPDSELRSSLSSAVKGRLRQEEQWRWVLCIHNLGVPGPSSSIWLHCMASIDGCVT